MAQIITVGIEYAKLMADVQAAITNALAAAVPTPTTSIEVGGMELAREITRLSEPRIYELVRKRQLPHSKRGNKLYFYRAELLAWIKAGSRNGGEVAYA